MIQISDFFPNDFSKASLLRAQRLVAANTILEDDFGEIELISGVDQSFKADKIISGIVVLNYRSFEIVEQVHIIQSINYPYIPTFLSFREGPAIKNAFRQLKIKPDLLMVDGAGINHPRHAGIATHIGVALNVPTIGITKKILCGSGKEPGQVGEAEPLIYEGRQTGWLLRSSRGSRAIIVAPGHRISLDTSLSIVKQSIRGHKLPEPVRLAHEYVNDLRKETH